MQEKKITVCQTCTSSGCLSITASNLLSILGLIKRCSRHSYTIISVDPRKGQHGMKNTKSSNMKAMSASEQKQKRIGPGNRILEKSVFFSLWSKLDWHFGGISRYYMVSGLSWKALCDTFCSFHKKGIWRPLTEKSPVLWKIVPGFHNSGCIWKNIYDYLNQRGPFFIETISFVANKPLILLNTANVFLPFKYKLLKESFTTCLGNRNFSWVFSKHSC